MSDPGGMLISGGGAGGLGQQAVSSSRRTPAEDVVDAFGRLRNAIQAARTAGWKIAIDLKESDQQQVGDAQPATLIALNISREV